MESGLELRLANLDHFEQSSGHRQEPLRSLKLNRCGFLGTYHRSVVPIQTFALEILHMGPPAVAACCVLLVAG